MKRYSISAVIASLAVVLLFGASYGQDAACNFQVNPTEIEFFDVSGGTVEINVTASDPSCTFTVERTYPWITVLSVNKEGIKGKVLIRVEGNSSQTHRVGELTVAGHAVNITQYGPRRGGSGS